MIDSYIAGRSPGFACEVMRMCERLGINDARKMLAIMEFESGISPSEVNRESGATGLIQFMPGTARELGTTCDALAKMTDLEQLPYVEAYMNWWSSEFTPDMDVASLYMAVLWPVAIKAPENFVMFEEPSVEYRQNCGLDLNGDGTVTKNEAAARVIEIYEDMCAPAPMQGEAS